MVYVEWHMDTAKTSVVVVVVVVSFPASRSHGHHRSFFCVIDVFMMSSLVPHSLSHPSDKKNDE
jgi:hypothetical protein